MIVDIPTTSESTVRHTPHSANWLFAINHITLDAIWKSFTRREPTRIRIRRRRYQHRYVLPLLCSYPGRGFLRLLIFARFADDLTRPVLSSILRYSAATREER